MKMRKVNCGALVLMFVALFAFSCGELEHPSGNNNGGDHGEVTPPSAVATTISVNSVIEGNTDEIVLGKWQNGQTIRIGDYVSLPLSRIEGTTAKFEFSEKFSRPFNALYPVSAYVDNNSIEIDGTLENLPFAAYVAKGQPVVLEPLCGGIRVPLKGGWLDREDVFTLAKVEVRGANNEQMSGVFELDYKTLTLTAGDDSPESKIMSKDLSVQLSSQYEKTVEILLPAGIYESGLVLKFIATDNSYYEYRTQTAFIVENGNYSELPLIWYRPGEVQTVITGYVRGTDGKALSGVVVSDGLYTAQTNSEGKYILAYSPEVWQPKFIFVSTPAEYSAPVVDGVVRYWKSWEECSSLSSVDFELIPVLNDPNRYTLYMLADTQIRSESLRSDRIAYKSIPRMYDTFRDLKEMSSAVVGRNCYAVNLGDLVSAQGTIFRDYIEGCKSVDFPIYPVIGNHDHGAADPTEEVGHATYEAYMGPRNYSANLGKFHLIVMDYYPVNPMTGNTYTHGMTDKEVEWLRNDLSYVPKETHLIFCVHGSIFMKAPATENSSSALNGAAYREIFSKYAKVYHFAGHAHSPFNYVYPEGHLLQNVEVHVVPRCTGILQLNEYIANGGAPQGFLICEVDGNDIRWKYHLTPYLSGDNLSNAIPPYTHRLWNFNGGVAYVGGTKLNDSYQIQPYNGGVYPDGLVYANVYMYDEKWGKVYLQVDGSSRKYEMERVPVGDKYTYDAAEHELIEFYNTQHSFFKEYGHVTVNTVRHLFRVKPVEPTGTGTISVTDRFGETFTAKVKW